jgi:hypothetical protein
MALEPGKAAQDGNKEKSARNQPNDPAERKMEEAVRAKVPSGTRLANAQQIMESEGFACKLMKNHELPEYGLGMRIDYLYCDRIDRSTRFSDPVARRWQVFLVIQKGAVTDIFVSTGLQGP